MQKKIDTKVTAILLTDNSDGLVEDLKPWSDEVLLDEDSYYKHFNPDIYEQTLTKLIDERNPELIMIGHTSQGMDLAPTLASSINSALITNITNLSWKGNELVTEREIFGGKLNSEVEFTQDNSHMVTVRQGIFKAEEAPGLDGSITEINPTIDESKIFRKFIEYIEPEAGEIDITASEILVSVGRGIEDKDNLEIIEDLAEVLGGDICGSRPVIDKGWIPEDRQVGQSGKTVAPKLYIAIGISGASPHTIGMKGSDIIVAINKDPNASIFEVSDYGIVDDLFNVVPKLTETIKKGNN